ncbi:hypothetical protein [Muribaculum intestinale]|uniref:hypothetical protein n=1 Tax=Muribaculum intestinale TaxID=1796646 RepID=UPI0025A9A533|nr:hypothetical protein [Muribaculum intestinale]
MNTPDTKIKRWGIVVIQSIPEGQPQTGTKLYEDLLRYKPIMNGNIFCELLNVVDKNDFEEAFYNILSKLEEGDILTIQVEAHGSVDGIALSSGEIVEWKEFYNLIRPINIALGHLLFIVMAMCDSIAMISNISIEQRAPYRAFICTTREMYPDELYEGFLSFYEKFCNLLDVSEAMTALQKEILDENGRSPFQLLSAEAVFEETLSSTRNIDDLCVNQLNRMVQPITQENLERMRGQIRELLVELQSKYSDYYNFRDLY